MAYDNTNRGAIWRNDNRETDRHPHFKGSINVEGIEYWVSAWKKEPDASDKHPVLKFTITPKERAHQEGIGQARQTMSQAPHDAMPQSAPQQAPQSPVDEFFDDDIPF